MHTIASKKVPTYMTGSTTTVEVTTDLFCDVIVLLRVVAAKPAIALMAVPPTHTMPIGHAEQFRRVWPSQTPKSAPKR